MLLKDIAKQNGFNEKTFTDYVIENYIDFCIKRSGEWKINENRADIEAIAEAYKKIHPTDAGKAKKEVLITPASDFEGYKILKHGAFICFDEEVKTDASSEKLLKSVEKARNTAINGLKEKALKMGCNAIINLSIDYLSLKKEAAPFGVSAKGNAVTVKRI